MLLFYLFLSIFMLFYLHVILPTARRRKVDVRSRSRSRLRHLSRILNRMPEPFPTPNIFSPPLTYRRNQLTEVRKIVCSILLITAVILSALYIRRYIGDCVVSFPKFGKKQASSSGGRLAGGPPVVQEPRDERAGADASGLAGGRPVHTVSTYVFLRELPRPAAADGKQHVRAPCRLHAHKETKAYW